VVLSHRFTGMGSNHTAGCDPIDLQHVATTTVGKLLFPQANGCAAFGGRGECMSSDHEVVDRMAWV